LTGAPSTDTVPSREMELRTAFVGGRSSPADAERAPSRARAKRGRLLIVDDEPHIGNTLRLLLHPDHDVVPVTSAHEALLRIQSEPPFDVVFCDLMMPLATGYDFYKVLEASAPHMVERLVFMTGGVLSTHMNAFLGAVPNTCIEKPFDLGALLALINERVRESG
jgi:CheY-like chemotaxis protein